MSRNSYGLTGGASPAPTSRLVQSGFQGPAAAMGGRSCKVSVCCMRWSALGPFSFPAARQAQAALEDETQWSRCFAKHLLIPRGERLALHFVEELRHGKNFLVTVEDGHAQDAAGAVASLAVDVGIEVGMFVGVANVQRLARSSHPPGDAGGQRNLDGQRPRAIAVSDARFQ